MHRMIPSLYRAIASRTANIGLRCGLPCVYNKDWSRMLTTIHEVVREGLLESIPIENIRSELTCYCHFFI